jgi:hypothetical protein
VPFEEHVGSCHGRENVMRNILWILLTVACAGCVQPVDEGAGSGGNKNPVIRSLTADPASIGTGGLTTITVVADDPENQPLSFSWFATSGDFFGEGATVRYTASYCCVGENQVRVSVRDNAGGVTFREISITVHP